MREPHRCSRHRGRGAGLALLASWLVACGDEADEPRLPPSAERTEAASGAVVESAPGPEASCARDLAEQTPAAVRATLGDLGYETLFTDVCLGQRAEQSGDPGVCAELTVSTLRDRCVARVAIAHERPTTCPAARTLEGRDPLCVALAAHDRRLCVVAGLLDRAVCEEVLGRVGACARLPDAERDTCATRAADLASRVRGEPRRTPPLVTSLEITATGGEPRSLGSADRGVRITYRGCARVIALGDAGRLTAPFGPPAIAIEIVSAEAAPLEVRLTNLPSEVSSTLGVSIDGTRAARATGGTLSLTTLEPELGGVVAGTFHAVLGGSPSAVDGTFATFVRDVDPRPSTCPDPSADPR